MASVVPLKTYSRKPVERRRGSVEAINDLFVKNICKRKEMETKSKPKRKKNIKIRELPPSDRNHYLLEDSILHHFNRNDTFDRLLRNSKKPECKIMLENNLSVELSVTKRALRRSKSGGLQKELSCNDRKLLVKEHTLDKPVNVSLFIEKIKQKNVTEETLSSFSTEKDKKSSLFQNQGLCPSLNHSIFTKSFMNYLHHVPAKHIASTPNNLNSRSLAPNIHFSETMSPILKECKSIVEESYNEVLEWSHTPPSSSYFRSKLKNSAISYRNKMTKKSIAKPKRDKKKYSSSPGTAFASVVKKSAEPYPAKPDWKLNTESKIVLDNTLDVLGIQQSVNIKRLNDFEGFTPSENKQTVSICDIYKDVVRTVLESIKSPVLYTSTPQKNVSYKLRSRTVSAKRSNTINRSGENNTPVLPIVRTPSFVLDHSYSKILYENGPTDVVILSSEDEFSVRQTSVNVDKLSKRKHEICKNTRITNSPVLLNGGKSWRRSLLEIRRTTVQGCVGSTCSCAQCRSSKFQKTSGNDLRPISRLSTIRQSRYSILHECSFAIDVCNTYVSNNTQEESTGCIAVQISSIYDSLNNCPREIVLQRCCQRLPLRFEECYTAELLENCLKVGEGVYGEVFLYKDLEQTASVIKIIPIEGKQLVNGEHQKTFSEILSEIIIAMELSNLRNDTKNCTNCFSEVKRVRCVQGSYPEHLLRLWDLYDDTYGSENDSPKMFKCDQLYIVLEFANGGKDMESYQFKNSVQAEALFKQIACALAIAESSLEFEHRDLHWGNILITNTVKSTINFTLNNREFEINTCGIAATIIDFTLSRIKYEQGVIYNDLSKDHDLFSATGDYQFEIYKLMQKKNRNNWQIFTPTSNLLWLDYVIDKMITALRYKYYKTKLHKNGISKLQTLRNRILTCETVTDFVYSEILS